MGQSTGSWIRAVFSSRKRISKFMYEQRCGTQESNKGIRLEFSGGAAPQTFTLESDKCKQQMFALVPPVASTFVKIVVTSAYQNVNNGATEIKFFGGGENLFVHQCHASSHLRIFARRQAPTHHRTHVRKKHTRILKNTQASSSASYASYASSSCVRACVLCFSLPSPY